MDIRDVRDILIDFLEFVDSHECYYNTRTTVYNTPIVGKALVDYYLMNGRKHDCTNCIGNDCPVCNGFGFTRVKPQIEVSKFKSIPPDLDRVYAQALILELSKLDQEMVYALFQSPKCETYDEANQKWNNSDWHKIIDKRIQELQKLTHEPTK